MTGGHHLLFVVSEDWYFASHRLALAQAALAVGYRVTVAAPDRGAAARIRASGITLVPWEVDRGGLGPFELLRTFTSLVAIYRRCQPDLIHHVALKPTILGGVAAAVSRMPLTLNAVAGLGWLYSSDASLARLLRPPVRALLRHILSQERAHTLVQNPADAEIFEQLGVPPRQLHLVAGSGIDLKRFPSTDEPRGIPVVVFPARLLVDKGLRELVMAGRALRADGIPVRILVAGVPDKHNRSAISPDELAGWVREGVIEYLGWVEDIPALFSSANIICLPSYREGLPKALLEGAAAGRCIVTTDVPGCRDVVREGENGLLVPPRDAAALTVALRKLLANPELRRAMGTSGRQRAEREWSTDVVLTQMLTLYKDLLA
jgi:glycosyltransferase involved in cell wall biosynthesis